MGSCQSKRKNDSKYVEGLKGKVRHLQSDINDTMCMRESESQAHMLEMMVFAFKEAEWKQQRKKLREEVKRLSKRLEETEEKKTGMEGKSDHQNPKLLGSNSLLEHIMKERAVRDETIEKWKQLYLAIKIELDDLIERTKTNQETGLYLKAEERSGKLRQELEDKVETIKLLQARLTSMEQENSKMKREMDILRQSLRIMSHKKKANEHCQRAFKKLEPAVKALNFTVLTRCISNYLLSRPRSTPTS